MKVAHRRLRDARRIQALDHLGGKCVICGATEKLHFHHLRDKSFEISTWLLLSWERLVVEVDKCELRCEAHHIDEHRSKAVCGTVQRYWRGCRCDPCKAAMSKHNREYNARRKAP